MTICGILIIVNYLRGGDGMTYYKSAVIIILFFILIILPIKFGLNIKRKPNQIIIIVTIVFWVIPIRFNIKNPLTKAFFKLSRDRFWKKKTPEDIAMKDISWDRISYRMQMFRVIGGKIFKRSNKLFCKWSKPMKIKELKVHTELALNDPAETALAVGAGWSVLGIVYSALTYYFDLTKTEEDISIIPSFDKINYLDIDFSCIFEFTLGHIIIIIYQLLFCIKDIWKLIRRVSQ